MSGVAVVRSLLAGYSNLTAIVPASRIYAGVLPVNIQMPAISIEQISGQQMNNLAMSSDGYLVEERVQITVLAKSYPQVKTILGHVRLACPLSRGTVNTINCQGVIPDTEGPDIFDQVTRLYSQSQDYIVFYVR